MNKEKVAYYIQSIFHEIGENTQREGLLDTPKRVAKMYKELFKGYNESEKPQITVFNNNADGIHYDQMIIDNGTFYSQCEHHMVPFFGEYHFGYIPDKKLIGLSKVARIIDWYSSKLQIQERLTKEIVDCIEEELKPRGIILILKARHLCKEMRGVKQVNGKMITSEVRGIFADSKSGAREEFLSLIK